MKTTTYSMFVILSVISVSVSLVSCDQPADCAILNNVVPECSCQGAPYNPTAIIIRCTNMDKMPDVNGTYSGLIEEFSLKDNSNLRELPDNAFAGLRIKFINLLGTRLNNISDFAFNGTTGDLTKLSISGDDMTDVLPPMTAIKSLHSLTSLHIHRFKPSNGDLEGVHLFNFPNLEDLTLEKMKLVSIASNVFALPNLTSLNLTENLFTSIPSESIHTLHKLTSLAIKGCFIYDLPGFFFDPIPNPQIKVLDFSRNNISVIETQFFKGITTTLQTLILTQNPLTTESKLNTISEVSSLVELRLESLGLKSLSANPMFLTNKPKLENLYLNGNQLKTMDVNVFSSASANLLKLDLSNNQLNALPDNIFNGFTALKQLYIQDQNIGNAKLSLPSFTPLTSLQLLDLQLTNLDTEAAWQQVKHLRSLVSINMDKTGLTHIADFVFRDMEMLEEINLHDNKISSITQKSFVGLRNSLETLYLNSNNISRIDHCTFDGFTKKLSLSLIDNPLHCDCELRWLKDKINNSEIVFIPQVIYHEQCSSPANNAGMNFKDVDVRDFLCNTHTDEEPCVDYYSSTTTTATEPPSSTSSPLPDIILELNIIETTPFTITFEYSVQNLEHVTRVTVDYTNLKTKETFEERLADAGTSHTIKRLDADTSYEICLEVTRTDNRVIKECKADKTPVDPGATTLDPSMTKKQESSDTGVIIGAVIGGIILLCLLVAIIFILFRKRHIKSEDIKAQNGGIVATSRANLPRVGYDSKRYVKKKKTNGAASTSANNNNVPAASEDIQVSVISDGQSNQNNLGRMSAGSYQFLDENSVNTKPSSGEYVNNSEARPLPKTPNKGHGYYNQAFDRSPSTEKENSSNTYSEINDIV